MQKARLVKFGNEAGEPRTLVCLCPASMDAFFTSKLATREAWVKALAIAHRPIFVRRIALPPSPPCFLGETRFANNPSMLMLRARPPVVKNRIYAQHCWA